MKRKERKAAAAVAAPEKPGFWKRLGKALLSTLVVLLLLAALACGGFVWYVSTVETIFPGITAAGEDLGGMTEKEAALTLTEAGYDNLNAVAYTVTMPCGEAKLTYRDVGMQHTAAEVAQTAQNYGKSDNLLLKTWNYAKCRHEGADLTGELFAEPNEAFIRNRLLLPMREARKILQAAVEIDVPNSTLTVIKGAQSIRLSEDEAMELILADLEQLKFGPITYAPQVEHDTVKDLEDLRNQFYAEVADAYYDKDQDTIIPEVIGVDFDDEVLRPIWEDAETGESVTLPVLITLPEETEAHLQEILFKTELSKSITTVKKSTENRKNNIRKACEAVNGLVLMPGEQISYNALLGQRTKENGYLEAGAYVNGEVVDQVGGGICQVSSAMYYCAVYANLQIDQRTNHTFQVSYMAPGLDATVSWGKPDLKFTNNRTYPIRFTAEVVNDEELVVQLWGVDDGTYVKVTTANKPLHGDEEYPTVETGFWTEAVRWVYNRETDELLSKQRLKPSEYHYHKENIVYPSPTPTPEETPDVEIVPEPESPAETPVPELSVP